jgi:hypothetical protein
MKKSSRVKGRLDPRSPRSDPRFPVAVATGFIAGKIIAIIGRRTEPYDDIEEFEL